MSETCTIETGEPGCVVLAGVLTFESTPVLFKETARLFHGPKPVSSLNLSGITSVDSAGLALLLEWQAMRPTASNKLKIINSPSTLMSLARLCDAVELLNMSARSRPS